MLQNARPVQEQYAQLQQAAQQKRAEVEAARKKAAEEQIKAQQQQRMLEQQRASLQKSETYAQRMKQAQGLQGLRQRQAIATQSKVLQSNISKTQAYQGELLKYQQDIATEEQKLKDYEAELAKYEAQQSITQPSTSTPEKLAYDKARLHYERGKATAYLAFGEDPLVKKYLKQMVFEGTSQIKDSSGKIIGSYSTSAPVTQNKVKEIESSFKAPILESSQGGGLDQYKFVKTNPEPKENFWDSRGITARTQYGGIYNIKKGATISSGLVLFKDLGHDKWGTSTSSTDVYSKVSKTSYGKLAKENLAQVPVKAFYDVAGVFQKEITAPATRKLTGNENYQGSEEARRLSADVFLGGFFGPAISTSSYSTSVQLSKSKFDKLKSLLGDLEKNVAKETNLKEQVNLLKQFSDKYKLTTEDKQALVKGLVDKGLLKPQPIDLGTSRFAAPQPSTMEITLNLMGVPTTKSSGSILGLTSTLSTGKNYSAMFDNALVKESTNQLQDKVILSLNMEKSKLLSPQQTKVKQQTNQLQLPKQLDLLKLNQPQLTKQNTRQQEQQLTKQLTQQQYKQPTKQETAMKKPRLFGWLDNKVKKYLSRNKESELYSVFGKRFGRDKEILTTSDKKVAEKALFSFLKGSLGRSGVIKKNNQPLSFEELSLFKGGEFRKSKVDKNRIVQKAEYSLGTFPERQEIKRAKNKKIKSFWR